MFNRLLRRPSGPPPLEQAMAKFQQGDTVTAENIVQTAVQEAVTRSGKKSREYASACCDLATVLMYLNQRDRAILALQDAVSTPCPTDREGRKDWLSYQMNLADLLRFSQRYDESAVVYQQNIEGRLAFYGREHAGYAFGLEPYAQLLMEMGRPTEALPVLNEVVRIFYKNHHLRVTGTLALRAEALKLANDPTPPFAGLEGMSGEFVQKMAEAIMARLGNADPIAYRALLQEFRVYVAERLGIEHSAYQNVLALIVENERQQGANGDFEVRLAAIQETIAIQKKQEPSESSVHALQGLGLALSEVGRTDEAIEAYDLAVAQAERSGVSDLLSAVLRNYGIYLNEIGRGEVAETLLRRAVTSGAAGEIEVLGRAEVALGIFLQHGGRLDEAQPALESALSHLPPNHQDALIARSHLQAIVTGGSCGCGNMESVMEEAFREFVMARLPEGMVDDIRMTMGPDGIQVQVSVSRALSDTEAQELNQAMEHATEAFRKEVVESAVYR